MTSAPASHRRSPVARARAAAVGSLNATAQLIVDRSGAGASRRVVLCYHSVHPSAPFASVSPSGFADHLDWLSERCDVVPIAQLLDPDPGASRPRVVITFDDGYLDNFEHAFPLLAARRLPATFFLTAGLIERDPSVVARMAALWGCTTDEVEPMSWPQALEMAAAGMTIGAHTWSHPNLATLAPDAASCELRVAKERLEERLALAVDAVAYPFGRMHEHVTPETIETARAAGYTMGLLTLPRAVRRADDPLRLPRLVVGDDDVRSLSQKVLGAIDWHAAIHERVPSAPKTKPRRSTVAVSSTAAAMDPLVSVVITSFNYARFLPTAIESTLEQSYANLEIVVVDDGSTDETQAVAARYAPRGVRYVYQENQGAGAARNTGLAATTGPLVAFLDADDVWLPEKTRKQLEHLRRHPELALVGCHAYGCETDLSVIDTVWGGNFAAEHAFERLLLRNFVLNPTCVLTRRAALDAVGGFSEVAMWEDWDTWLRIARRFPIGFTPEPLVKVRRHDRGLSPRSGYERLAEDATILNRHLRYAPVWKRPIIRRRARSVAYLHAGRAALVAGDRDVARSFSVRALVNDPTMLTRQKIGMFVRTHTRGLAAANESP